MQATALPNLTTFNRMALHYQDEVFTLAYYLSGDETSASEAAQSAFQMVYRQGPGLKLDRFRNEVMRNVLRHYHQSKRQYLPRHKAGDEVAARLLNLKDDEREAVILVDVLGMSYEEAGAILGCSKKQVNHLVAQARLDLSHLKVLH
jgi:DNA-directed RNA polymerase specialized sigma24 family protein